MRQLLCAALITCFALPAFADETSGEIVALDRVSRIMVLDDMTIWQFSEATELSSDLLAGDKVTITYAGGGDAGIGAIASILRSDG